LWHPYLVVLLQSIGWCIIFDPPTSLISTSSGLPAHIRVHTSRQHQKLYHHPRLYCAYLLH
jgi:hypothetical protein